MVQRLSTKLNLTTDQQKQAREIFRSAREQVKALQPKLREERVALRAAVKTDNEAQIDQVLQQNSQANTQAREIHAKAMAKFYQVLNPAQKAQFDQMAAHRWERGAKRAHQAGQSTESR